MRFAPLTLALMTMIPRAAVAQADPEPAGAAGNWTWVAADSAPERRFRLFIPANVQPGAPLVILLHGCTQDPDDLARGTRFNVAAAERGVVVAYPEQDAAHNPLKCWNWFVPAHQGADGEPGLIAGIARQVMAQHDIDPARVYVGGISAGGSMALNVVVASGDLFAAVGSHSGIAYRAADDMASALTVMRGEDIGIPPLIAAVSEMSIEGHRPPLFAIQGESDAVVSPKNLALMFLQWSTVFGAGTTRDDSLQVGGRTAVRTRLTQSDGSIPVEVWRVLGLGHAWSGGAPAGTYTDPAGPDASRLMLEFFLKHPKMKD